MNANKIPDIIIGRLPIYLRALQRMAEKGVQNTSSQELGERVGISAAQIRKDISQFGEFGKQGTGYRISFLIDKLREILKIDRIWDVVIVGAGDMGHAEGFGEKIHFQHTNRLMRGDDCCVWDFSMQPQEPDLAAVPKENFLDGLK